VHPYETFAAELRSKGITLHDLNSPALLKPSVWLALRRTIQQERPDVIQTWMHHADFIGSLAAYSVGYTKVVWGVRATEVHRNPGDSTLKTAIFHKALGWAAKLLPQQIISNSEAAVQVHVDMGFPRQKMVVVPNGVDAQRFKPDTEFRQKVREELQIPAEAPVIGFVGRFHPVKDLPLFFRAAAIAQRAVPQLHFLLCGGVESELPASAHEAYQAVPQRQQVHFVPFGSSTQRYYPAMDLFSLTSSSEAFPNVVLEAMASGLPCATTAAGDCAPMLEGLGKVVPVGDTNALATAWQELLKLSTTEREDLGRLGRERVLERYTPQRALEGFQRIYRNFLACATVLMAFFFSVNLSAQEIRSALSLWATDGMARIFRDTPAGEPVAPKLYAASNEWEAFQLVVSGTPQELKQITVHCRSLRSVEGNVIAAPVILRQHYVEVTEPSELSPGKAGWYPDALVPQYIPTDDPPLLTNGRVNQPYWIDIYVPKNTPPGDYQSELQVRSPQGDTLHLPFNIHVWDFELPRLPAMRTSIFVTWRRLAEVHGYDRNAPSGPEGTLLNLLNDYYDMLVEHRLSPHEVWEAYPDPHEPISKKSYQAIEQGLHRHLIQRGAGTIGLPLWLDWPFAKPLTQDRKAALKYCAAYYRICEKLGCEERLYKIFGELDEPRDAAGYEQVREWGKFFDELRERHGIKIPLLITEHPTPENPDWGSLHGSVDIWVPHVSNVWQDLESAKPLKELQRRLSAGEQLWTYTALVQAPEEWKATRNNPKQITNSHPPVWLLDYPAINHRLLGWLMPLHGITGMCYWDTSYWRKPDHDPWKSAATYPHDNGSTYWGDGMLIYPLHQKTHGKEGPSASIRLKWIRESVDDYDYLMLMQARGLHTQARDLTRTFARGFGDWKDDTTALYEARRVMGERLSKKVH
jgi:glycosyltransferase involved in cell wall biosynthesis